MNTQALGILGNQFFYLFLYRFVRFFLCFFCYIQQQQVQQKKIIFAAFFSVRRLLRQYIFIYIYIRFVYARRQTQVYTINLLAISLHIHASIQPGIWFDYMLFPFLFYFMCFFSVLSFSIFFVFFFNTPIAVNTNTTSCRWLLLCYYNISPKRFYFSMLFCYILSNILEIFTHHTKHQNFIFLYIFHVLMRIATGLFFAFGAVFISIH